MKSACLHVALSLALAPCVAGAQESAVNYPS